MKENGDRASKPSSKRRKANRKSQIFDPKSNGKRSEELDSGKSTAKSKKRAKKADHSSHGQNEPKQKLSVTSRAVRKSSEKLATTECPDCKKTITIKGLKRHREEKHDLDSKTFKCDMCTHTTKREACLMDHYRRQHFESAKLGRPKKGKKRARSRSPFRMETFKKRHQPSMDLTTKLLADNNEQKQTLEQKIHEIEENNQKITAQSEKLNKILVDNDEQKQKLEQKIQEFEVNNKKIASQSEQLNNLLAANVEQKQKLEQKMQDFEVNNRKLATRMSIIESKLPEKEFPSLNDIPSLLQYFNLSEDCNKTEIRNTVNLRQMGVSSQSTLSGEIYSTGLTEEKRKNLNLYMNKASSVLIKWTKERKNT